MAPIPPAPIERRRSPSLRQGLRRLSVGLLVYGALGLGVAVVGLVALVYLGGRLGGVAERTSEQVDTLVTTLDDSATVLAAAGTSALSFSVTLERTPPTVRQAAQTVANLRGNLRTVESQLASLSLLGSRPLADVAALFGQMANDMEGLDTRLGLIADDLGDNRDKLLANAASLRALGARLDAIADELRGGRVQESLADVQMVATYMALILVAWTALPALGALLLGWWLRRTLGPDGPPRRPDSAQVAP